MLRPRRPHHDYFRDAWSGLVYIFESQPNFRLHLASALIVIVASYLLSTSTFETLILLFAISLVIVSEMLNTSVESMVDLITKEHREDAKIAKDVAAGMVLVSAIFAVIAGVAIFIPKILNLI